jgi:hypothetical protein
MTVPNIRGDLDQVEETNHIEEDSVDWENEQTHSVKSSEEKQKIDWHNIGFK